MFINSSVLSTCSWQAFERMVCRLLFHEGFEGIRAVGQSGDGGADIIARRGSKRWLFQVKRLNSKTGADVIDRTLEALHTYNANVPVVVTLKGFTDAAYEQQAILQSERIPLQLWDRAKLLGRVTRLNDVAKRDEQPGKFEQRPYQEQAVQAILHAYIDEYSHKALVVLATGLGKTYVAAEAVRRLAKLTQLRVLVIAHANDLVYQLERAFWPFLKPSQETLVWNGIERGAPEALARASLVFGCLPSIAESISQGVELPAFDIVLIDECHHAGGEMYVTILDALRAGKPGGPFLLGLTATPWRPDNFDLSTIFGQPLIALDLITGMRMGFLANVDYRLYTDNIDWRQLANLKGESFSPRAINRTLFISEWDDAVVLELKNAWGGQSSPRAIVFCGTINHAITMKDRLNAYAFCHAEALYSRSARGNTIPPYERNRILSDFDDGKIHALCVVDIFNEGIDVPDVNILVFQRVTHSRRIFIQQLGRGLRLAPGKDRVVVLDFVSDIRRFAAGLDLKDQLEDKSVARSGTTQLRLPNKVSFQRLGKDDPETESFLREWLADVAAVEAAGEDTTVLKFPPTLPESKR